MSSRCGGGALADTFATYTGIVPPITSVDGTGFPETLVIPFDVTGRTDNEFYAYDAANFAIKILQHGVYDAYLQANFYVYDGVVTTTYLLPFNRQATFTVKSPYITGASVPPVGSPQPWDEIFGVGGFLSPGQPLWYTPGGWIGPETDPSGNQYYTHSLEMRHTLLLDPPNTFSNAFPPPWGVQAFYRHDHAGVPVGDVHLEAFVQITRLGDALNKWGD